MDWIQYTLRFCLKEVLIFLSVCSSSAVSFAQSDKVILNLPLEVSSLFKQRQFYIQNVEDSRKTPGAALGNVIVFGKETPIAMPRSVEKELFGYWSYEAPKKEQTYLPLYITVKDLSVSEKRTAPNKVTGGIKLSVTFRWYRNMQPVELTNFQTSATYTRPEKDYDHARLVKQMLDQALSHFNKWMTTNVGKNPALARNLIIVFKEIYRANESDTVFYSPKRPLVWDDFRGKSRPSSRYAAAVFTSFSYEGRSYPKDADLVLEIGLKTFMVKSMSWGNSNARDANTIRHEQIHFDITRMVVERFKKRLQHAELTIEDYDSEIQYQFLETFREMNTEQETYDAETGHGTNGGAQAAWDRKVAKEIAAIYSAQQ